jgi:hypothetical protein
LGVDGAGSGDHPRRPAGSGTGAGDALHERAWPIQVLPITRFGSPYFKGLRSVAASFRDGKGAVSAAVSGGR